MRTATLETKSMNDPAPLEDGAELEGSAGSSGGDLALSIPASLRESEDFIVAVHEAAHAVIAHHLGYAVEGLVVGLEGDEKGYVIDDVTRLTEIGVRAGEGVTPVIWPHVIDEVHNQLLILFAGALAVAKVTGLPYPKIKGGGGDNEAALRLIRDVEALRRQPGFEFITDTYRPFLYPGSLLECAKLIGREDLVGAILSVAEALAAERALTGEAFQGLMSESGIVKGRRWFEKRPVRPPEP